MSADTIFALATPFGRSGVAVVRISGPQAKDGLISLSGETLPPPRLAALKTLSDPAAGTVIDRAVVILFEAPASYTGEDVVEYQIHGGPAVIQSLIAALSRLPGCRMAGPGEFTRRAFENGRMDLTAAEAVADLINAETEAQKSQALSQMEGALARLYDGWTARLTRALAYLEADLDFPDEDLPAGVAAQVMPVLQDLMAEMDAHMNDNRRGEILRDGVQVAVIGAPNAGKSSLVNALAQRDVAIVSEHAGTTRDIIEIHLNLKGFPVTVADTAGLRPDQMATTGHDGIEQEGIRRALDRAHRADIRLLVFDAAALPALDPHTLALVDDKSLVVFNKGDLHPDSTPAVLCHAPVVVSAKTGAGLDRLTDRLVTMIAALIGPRETPSLTRARHRAALDDCRAALARALAADPSFPELMAEDIRLASRALGRITGRVDAEALLDIIFRDFCIGK